MLDLSWDSEFSPLWTPRAVTEHFGAMSSAELERLGLGGRAIHDIIAEIGLDRSGELVDKYLRAKRNQSGHARWLAYDNSWPITPPSSITCSQAACRTWASWA